MSNVCAKKWQLCSALILPLLSSRRYVAVVAVKIRVAVTGVAGKVDEIRTDTVDTRIVHARNAGFAISPHIFCRAVTCVISQVTTNRRIKRENCAVLTAHTGILTRPYVTSTDHVTVCTNVLHHKSSVTLTAVAQEVIGVATSALFTGFSETRNRDIAVDPRKSFTTGTSVVRRRNSGTIGGESREVSAVSVGTWVVALAAPQHVAVFTHVLVCTVASVAGEVGEIGALAVDARVGCTRNGYFTCGPSEIGSAGAVEIGNGGCET